MAADDSINPRRHSLVFECFQIGSLCLIWYSKYRTTNGVTDILIWYNLGSSAAGNVIVKELLDDFPFPLTVTLVQLFSIWILCIPLIKSVLLVRIISIHHRNFCFFLFQGYGKFHHRNILIKIVSIILK